MSIVNKLTTKPTRIIMYIILGLLVAASLVAGTWGWWFSHIFIIPDGYYHVGHPRIGKAAFIVAIISFYFLMMIITINIANHKWIENNLMIWHMLLGITIAIIITAFTLSAIAFFTVEHVTIYSTKK